MTRLLGALVFASIVLLAAGCSVSVPPSPRGSSYPRPELSKPSRTASDAFTLQLSGPLATPGIRVVDAVRGSVSSTATSVQVRAEVDSMDALVLKDVFVVMASTVTSSARDVGMRVDSLRPDGTVDVRIYRWTGREVEFYSGRMRSPAGTGNAVRVGIIHDIDRKRLIEIAGGGEPVPPVVAVK